MEPMEGYRPSERRCRAMTRRREMPLWQELPLLLVVAFCLAVLIRTFAARAITQCRCTLQLKNSISRQFAF